MPWLLGCPGSWVALTPSNMPCQYGRERQNFAQASLPRPRHFSRFLWTDETTTTKRLRFTLLCSYACALVLLVLLVVQSAQPQCTLHSGAARRGGSESMFGGQWQWPHVILEIKVSCKKPRLVGCRDRPSGQKMITDHFDPQMAVPMSFLVPWWDATVK